MDVPVERWLPRAEVAKRLGVSEKTVERMERRGLLTRADRRVPGRKPVPVYDPADVERIAQATVRPVVVQERRDEPQRGGGREVVLHAGARVAEAVSRLLAAQVGHQKLLLSVDEAAAFSGLPKGILRRALRSGELRGLLFPGSVGWRVARSEVERFVTALVAGR